MEADPYNFPFPQRRDLMSLSTIPQNKRALAIQSKNMEVDDIDGTRSKMRGFGRSEREPASLSTRIEEFPCNWKKVQVRSDSLRIDDIAGTRPKPGVSTRITRQCNPLEPVYQLPSYPEIVPEPPRPFLRDTLDISDIPIRNVNRLKKAPLP